MPTSVPQSAPHHEPPELGRWNWGAFLLNWVWGIGNNTYIALLTLIPFVGLVMPFVLGFKGNAWAWRNGRWDSVAHFKRVQRKWAIWGAVIWIGAIALFGSTFSGVFVLFKNSEAYQLGVAKVQSSPIATNILGTPITAGTPYGTITVTPGSGNAILSFTATGPRKSGLVALQAVKTNGVWSLTRLTLTPNGSDSAIDLLNADKNSAT
jgi:hypothetical protein